MEAKDEKWVVPILAVLFVVLVGLVNFPQAKSWYDDYPDAILSPLSTEELAGWIVEGSNEFVPIYLQKDPNLFVDDIPGLVTIQHDSNLAEKIESLPTYKKWVVLTSNGKVNEEEAKILTADWKTRVFYLEGGIEDWRSKITAADIESLNLDDDARIQLKRVRVFFHPSEIGPVESYSEPDRFIAEPEVMPSLLEEVEFEEEEGC